MRKVILTLSLFSVAAFGAFAQKATAVEAKEYRLEERTGNVTFSNEGSQLSQPNMRKAASQAAVVWSEDFGSGFTSTNGTWSTGGQNANLVIPSTTGPTNFNFPIPTDFPTGSNGIALFDFDDNIPDDPNTGNGFANQPAEGLLTSPVIDLSGHPNVEIVFYQAIFHCCEIDFDAYLEISTDGGTTFPHQIAVDPVDRNERHWELGHGFEFAYDISDEIAANPSNVVIRFNWTSLTPDQNNQFANHYFWMIDDIVIQDLPAHSMVFTPLGSGAPANDIVYPNGAPRYGNLHLSQAVPITFDSNVLNYGHEDQTNVSLLVTIEDQNNNQVASLSSPAVPVVGSKDTATWHDLQTSGSWTPTSTGTYTITYRAVSDSIPAGSPNSPVVEKYELRVNDSTYNDNRYSYHFGDEGDIDGYIGTNSTSAFVTEAISLPYTFPNPSPDTAGHVLIDSMTVPFSNLTDPAALIAWQIYDTTGGFGASGPQGNMVFDSLYTLDPSVKGNYYGFDFRQMEGGQLEPLTLPTGGYYFVMNIALSDPDSVVRFGYSIEDFDSPYRMRRDDNTWFGGFIGVSTPIFMLHMSGSGGLLNAPPVADFTATPTSGNMPLTVNFDASTSSDADGDTLSYSWDFDNGNFDTGVTTSTTFNNAGIYDVVLTVDDGNGGTDQHTVRIAVTDTSNTAPTADLTVSHDTVQLTHNQVITFDASASNDPDGDPLTYEWDFGDGSPMGTGQSTQYTYTSAGTFWVVLTVYDDQGGLDQDSVQVTVINDMSLNELSPAKLSIFPNPTEGEVFVTVEDGGNFTLEVTSIAGQRVHSESIKLDANVTLTRDFSHLPKGSYLITISNEKARSTQNLTIK